VEVLICVPLLSGWYFTTGNDPTHGLVSYQSRNQALAKKLAYVKEGVTVLTVDANSTVPVGGKRDSYVDSNLALSAN
jgi:hypothetical protein